MFLHAAGLSKSNDKKELWLIRLMYLNTQINPWLYVIMRKESMRRFYVLILRCTRFCRSEDDDQRYSEIINFAGDDWAAMWFVLVLWTRIRKALQKAEIKAGKKITKHPFFVRKIKSSKVKRDQLSRSIDHMPKDYVHVCSIFIFLFLSLFWFLFSLLKKNQLIFRRALICWKQILDIGRPIPIVTIYIIISNEKKKPE